MATLRVCHTDFMDADGEITPAELRFSRERVRVRRKYLIGCANDRSRTGPTLRKVNRVRSIITTADVVSILRIPTGTSSRSLPVLTAAALKSVMALCLSVDGSRYQRLPKARERSVGSAPLRPRAGTRAATTGLTDFEAPNSASARGVRGISRERHSRHRKAHTHILFECRSKCVPTGNADQPVARDDHGTCRSP
jgi:hypothetical protein